jgi:phospholipid/cholesterol/gamma-HCH transport system ATP-binding protein
MSDEPIIRVEDVHLRFGRVEVLRGVSFVVKPRETVCILGGSGGGKSTLLKVMIGNLKPTSGRVIVDGDDIVPMGENELNAVRRKFGVMFQLGALLNSMTIAENVALPIEFHTKLDEEVINTMVKIKLNQVDLREAAAKRPSEISGGMQKRAAIARALARDP